MEIIDEVFLTYIQVFLAVFTRCLGVVISVPVFGSRGIPVIVKAGIALFLAGIITPMIDITAYNIASQPWSYGIIIISELLLGLTLGYIINLFFVAVQMAGSFIDLPIGFRAANLVDPQWGYPVPLVGHFKYFAALALFFVFNGHHLIIQSLVMSFRVLPTVLFSSGGIGLLVNYFAKAFAMAFQISLPVVGAIFLTDCAFAMLARASPQINVFLLGFTLKIIVGIAILALAFPYFVQYSSGAIKGIYEDLMLFLNSF